MKLPDNPHIAPEKLTHYLLVRQARSDKSGYLAKAGYLPDNWEALQTDLLGLATTGEAEAVEINKFGEYFAVAGVLRGPNGTALPVRTIWMTEHLSKVTKFITLTPDDSP